MVDKSVKVVLRADVANYVRGMQEAARSTRELEMGSENIDEWGEKWSSAAENIGGKMLIAGGAIAAGLGLGVKAAVDWESAWTGVLKTVDGTPQQLSMVEDGLREMTSVLPASHEEIAAVAEAAGQLGIQTENVVGFTRTMIDLGETTNLSAEQAAMSLAQFVNIMGTSQSEAENLGSAIVGLGNNFATTESSILEMAMRLAGAGAQVGFTEGEVLGLATALSSVGIEAEAGGSAMSKVMIDIAASVEEGGDRLEQFASVAGMTGEQFAKLWREDSAAGLTAFVQGLADAESQGSSTLGVLADLGITEVRMRDALLRASSAAGTFTEAMSMGNDAYAENLALAEEAELRYGTTESQLGILKNRFTEAGIALGTALTPALEAGVGVLGWFADALAGLDGGMSAVVAWGGLTSAALLLAGGAFLTIVPKIAEFKKAIEMLGLTRVVSGIGLVGAAALAAAPLVLTLAERMSAAGGASDRFQMGLYAAENAVDALAASSQKWADEQPDNFFGLFASAEKSADDIQYLADNLVEVAEANKSIRETNNWADYSMDVRGASSELSRLSQNLAEVAQRDLTQAADAFAMLVDETDGAHDSIMAILDGMPEFRDELVSQAQELGIVDGELDTYKEQLALVEWISGRTTESTSGLNEELSEQEQAAAEAEQAVSDLADAIRAYDDLMLGLMNTEVGFYQALDDVNAALADNGSTLDLSTEAGRNNQSALADLAQSTNDYAASVWETTESADEAAAALEQGRTAFIEAATAMGMGAEEAAELADKLMMLPDDVTVEANIATATLDEELTAIVDKLDQLEGDERHIFVDAMTEEAYDKLKELGFDVVELSDGRYRVTIDADTDLADQEMADLVEFIEASGGTVEVSADTSGAEWSIDQLNGKTITVGAYIRQIGTLRAYGGFDEYASGGIRRNVPTGIYPGGANIVKFAEPETRWEAYISGKPGLEKQNIGYALEALDRLGYWREYADGGVLQQASYQASAPVVNVSSPDRGMSFSQNVTVTEAMSGAELVSLMRREAKRALADEMRSYR